MPHLGFVIFAFSSILSLTNGFSTPPSTRIINNCQNGPSSNSNLRNEKGQPAENSLEHEIYRLTDELSPTSYELRLVPDLKTFTFGGKVEISIRVKFTTNKIILHSRNLTVQSVRVFKIDTSRILVNTSYNLDEFNDLLIIETSQCLPFSTDYIIVIEFQGVLGDNFKGFYRSSYTIGSAEKWIAVTQLETNYARRAFPCFDEPRFKTPFTIYLACSPDQFAVSNMPMESRLPSDSMSGADRLWVKFQKSPAMPTYSVSYMVSDFSYITETGGNNIRLIARNNTLQKGIYALKQAIKALKQLEGYIGISYKLPKLDLVAVPDFSKGGSENWGDQNWGTGSWGMITFRERSLLMDESRSSARHRQEITETITRELAHQWFGNSITPAWYSYLWLKEGIARYLGAYITAALEPNWNLDHLFVVENVLVALKRDRFALRPLTTTIQKNFEIGMIQDTITYNKAASILRMFEHMLSPNTFRNALHRFLSEGEKIHRGVVIEKNLLDAFDIESQRFPVNVPPRLSITEIMKGWTENNGYPLISVNRSYDDGKINITQSPHTVRKFPSPIKNQNWIIPLTYTTKSKLKFDDTRPTLWSLADGPIRLSENISNTDWVLFNLQHVGHYRVNYDRTNWNLLIDQLKQDHRKIHVLNRAQLISDAYSLAQEKHLTYQVAIKLTEYLVNETDMIPWYAAIQQFNHYPLRDRLKTGNSSDRFLTNYLHNLFKQSFNKIGFEIKPNDSHVTKIVKPKFLEWACKLDVEDCIRKSLEEYEKNKADLTKVQADLKPVVYCYALRNSTDQRAVYKNLWTMYTNYDDPFEKHKILAAVLCATDTEVIKQTLSKIIDPKNKEIRKQDQMRFIDAFAWHGPAGTAVYEFMLEKLDNTTQLDSDDVEFLILLLRYTSDDNTERIQLKKDLGVKFSSLDQNKYGDLTTVIKQLLGNGINMMERNSRILERIQKEALQLNE
ncbi:aminopeptidase N-like [Planococcus citri]|uniref:aminopeptidase N-like n=1 Tax=Planococcus citri TaxID=170843 RepID=UPI0031F7EDC7